MKDIPLIEAINELQEIMEGYQRGFSDCTSNKLLEKAEETRKKFNVNLGHEIIEWIECNARLRVNHLESNLVETETCFESLRVQQENSLKAHRERYEKLEQEFARYKKRGEEK